MSEYKFRYQENGDDICLIETSTSIMNDDIIDIIREYSNYKIFGRGYNNLQGSNVHQQYMDEYNTSILDEYELEYNPYDKNKRMYYKSFYAYHDNERIVPSAKGDRKYMYGDIRRVLGDIIYVLYYKEKRENSITKIIYMNMEYINIRAVDLIDDDRITFVADAKKTDETEEAAIVKDVKVLVPISLKGHSSRFSDRSSRALFSLYNRKTDTDLHLYDKEKIYEGDCKNEFEIDRFWGTHEGFKGIFYYFHNELTPQYAVKTDENGKYIFRITDMKQSIYSNECKNLDIQCDEANKQYIHNFVENPLVNQGDYTKFEENIRNTLWNKAIDKNEINEKYENDTFCGKKKKGRKDTYQFDIDDFTYEVKVSKREFGDSAKKALDSDYFYEVIELGTIRLNNDFFIELYPTYEQCNFGNEHFKVNYETLSELGTLLFPKSIEDYKSTYTEYSKGNNDEKIYTLPFIKEYIRETKTSIKSLKETLEEKCKESGTLNFLKEHSLSNNSSDLMAISKKLYPAPNVADKEIVAKVYELKCLYKETGKLPNLAILGGPGTGKSTLVNRIAKFLLDNDRDDNILYKSTSDLKGAYIGHTGAKMFDLLTEAAKNNKIIFIDEAYNLQKDDFGKEALEICLPLLTGDRKEIEAPPMGNENKTQKYNFEEEGTKIPAIWFAGYEHEMRKMLSENPGLYRRMHKITLSTPTVDGLYACLLKKCHDGDIDLTSVFEKSRDDIRNYFGWATAKEHVSYFANYAGVDDFFITCKIRMRNENNENVQTNIINEIIDEKKKEIKKQYKAVLTDIEKIEFEVQNDIDTVLDDVKGNQNVVKNLKGIVTMMLNQEDYRRKGIHLPKGALLIGPPGTGKTMLARAVAGELQKQYNEKDKKDIRVAFIPTIATELGSPKKISALFNEAAEYDTSVIFIDEIDAIGKHRNMQGAFPTLLIQLMKEMDGFESRKNVFVMAATNDPASLDPALKRPGRFDRTIEVSYPDKNGRIAILSSALKKLWIFKENEQAAGKLAKDLAEKTIQYAPANLINLVNEAAILFEECEKMSEEYKKSEHVPEHRKNLQLSGSDRMQDIEKFTADISEMLERINIGELNVGNKEETFQTNSNEGCSAVAIHEVGHAMVSLLSGLEPFEKITIISRGDALGYVSPSTKNPLRTKRDFLTQIRICLGGRVAEELFYGEDISTGAVQDIQQATIYAEKMITLFGMSDVIGPMSIKTHTKNYLGNTGDYGCSDAFRFEVDNAIKDLLSEQMSITRNMLETRKEDIEHMARHIFNEETATGEEFKNIYQELRESK